MKAKGSRLQASVGRVPPAAKPRRRFWTAAEDDAIRSLYATTPVDELAAKLRRSARAVYQRGMILGVASKVGSDAHRERCSQANRGHRRSPATEFKKGNKPWSTGMRGIHLSPATEFKPGCLRGQAARNHRCVGWITERRDKPQNGRKGKLRRWIKVREDGPPQKRWVRLAVYMWERVHGPVPEGMRLVHLDGDTMNSELTNLALMTCAQLLDFQRRTIPGMNERRVKRHRIAQQKRWEMYRALKEAGVIARRRARSA